MSHAIKIAPSILASDFACLAEEVQTVEAAGANVFVAGVPIIHAPEGVESAIKAIRQAAQRGSVSDRV
jgi:pentose-5-phosphate-3-epimerase